MEHSLLLAATGYTGVVGVGVGVAAAGGVDGRRGGGDGGGNGVGEGEGRRGGESKSGFGDDGDGADFSGDSEALLGRPGFAQSVGLELGEIGDGEC